MLQPLTVGNESNMHNGFPCLCRQSNGRLILVWRRGTNHYQSRDGVVMMATSDNDGAVWIPAKDPIRKYPDYRDPNMVELDGVLNLTWFGANVQNEAMGAGIQRDWWDYSIRIDPPNNPNGAITAPLVKLPSGQYGAAFYGKQPGDPLYTCFMGWSNDNGWSWTTNRIINMIGQGIATTEPYLVVGSSIIHMFFRWGNNAIGVRSSTNSGISGSWGEPRITLNNATGRPTTIMTASGRFVMIYRDASNGDAILAHSTDLINWTKSVLLMAPSGGMMTYASMVEISPLVLYVVCGMENANSTSQLWGGYVSVPA